jgi:hydrogenase nickel incorporation protein HypA/HybF
MHEWALAESVLSAALDEAKKQHLQRITEITITLGELQQIEEDIFRFALGELVKTHTELLKKVTIIIKKEECVLSCNQCHTTWNFKDIQKEVTGDEAEAIHFVPEVAFVHSRCPTCGSPDFEITKGRGVTITQIKGIR